MTTIKRFKEIVSWQKARELNKVPGKHIDDGKFKKAINLLASLKVQPVLSCQEPVNH